MADNISCPISHITINENRVRVVALFVCLTSLSYLILPFWAAPALLVIDFLLRIIDLGRYSPFNLLAGWIVRILSLDNKPVDQAPKRFAAQMGFLLSVLLLASAAFYWRQTAFALAGILVLFSLLESALGFCAGCHIYSFVRKVFPSL